MATAEIKEALDEWLEEQIEFSDEKAEALQPGLGKWKRLSKSKDSEGQWNRTFQNTALNKQVLVVEDDIVGWLANKEYVFHIDEKTEPDSFMGSDVKCVVSVSDLGYFQTEGFSSDWHISGLVALPAFLYEEMEGVFSSKLSVVETRQALLDYGFVEDEAFSELILSELDD